MFIGTTVCKGGTKHDTINEYMQELQGQILDETKTMIEDLKKDILSINNRIREKDVLFHDHVDNYKATCNKLENHMK